MTSLVVRCLGLNSHDILVSEVVIGSTSKLANIDFSSRLALTIP